jgi:hypothetical protein
MAEDFLEQLAQLEVQAPPAEFDRQLHQRVNRSLVAQQLLDLVVGGFPWALLRFSHALAGLIALSITGRFGGQRKA